MNRPRNRQPRPQDSRGPNNAGTRPGHPNPATRAQAFGTVPTVRLVVPGASVWIVLKEDQPTGDETPGVVQDILTRGNHPRGIKVRLTDGQVGRVQRMGNNHVASPPPPPPPQSSSEQQQSQGGSDARFTMRYTDVRNDDYLEGPPPRSLADFMPDEPSYTTVTRGQGRGQRQRQRRGQGQEPVQEQRQQTPGASVKCPFCGDFEGDEVAVTHHIDQAHLT